MEPQRHLRRVRVRTESVIRYYFGSEVGRQPMSDERGDLSVHHVRI